MRPMFIAHSASTPKGWAFFFSGREQSGVEVTIDREKHMIHVYFQRDVTTPDDIYKALHGLKLADGEYLSCDKPGYPRGTKRDKMMSADGRKLLCGIIETGIGIGILWLFVLLVIKACG